MAPTSPSYDDPSSFLFGLNHFGSPGMGDSSSSGGGGGQGNGPQSLLAGLDSFGGNGNHDGTGNDLLEGGSFADELALWTNANFSFDGPTGHALLGDEEKDKKDKDKEDDDKDAEDRRAGKRVRNNENDRDAAGRPLARNGKNRLRDEDGSENADMLQSQDPTHQAHLDQAAQQQQQHYFAPPSSRADEARRPGFGNMAGAPNGSSGPGINIQQQSVHPPQMGHAHHQPQQMPYPFPSSFPNTGINGNVGQFGQSPFGQQAQHGQGTQSASQQLPMSNNGQVDLTSLLAIQQLLTSNPLALATLGSFTGLNPQLGLLGGQLGQLGQMSNGGNQQQFLQQLQQQLQQQPAAQRVQHSAFPQSIPASQPQSQQASQQPSPFPGSSTPMGFPAQQQMNQPNFSMAQPAMPYQGMISHSMNGAPNGPGIDASGHNGAMHDGANGTKGRSRASSGDESGNDSKAKTKQAAARAAEEQAEADREADENDGIPPLKLVDTGNPIADAEANRLAIEEDKRRRNTAASARFRVKKKQREAALEAHTKELEDQVSELREELDKLRNENQWLKGLIQVRAGPDMTAGASGSGMALADGKGPLMSAMPHMAPGNGLRQVQAFQQQQQQQQQPHQQSQQSEQDFGSASGNSSFTQASTAEERARHTGLDPRGVGTSADAGAGPSTQQASSEEAGLASSGAGQKRDRDV